MAEVKMSYTEMRDAATNMETEITAMRTVKEKIGNIIDDVAATGFGNNSAIGGKLAQVRITNNGIIATVLKDCETMVAALNKVARDAEAQEQSNADAYKKYAGMSN